MTHTSTVLMRNRQKNREREKERENDRETEKVRKLGKREKVK